jgi:hypothetical protein
MGKKECELYGDLDHQRGPSGIVTGTGEGIYSLFPGGGTHLLDAGS